MAREVFISYSHIDAGVANEACAKLEESGIPCWIAPRDAVPGERYPAQIVEAITSARLLLLILSRHANESAQVQSEVERAFSKGVTILPMRIEDFTPTGDLEYLVAGTHWFDATAPPFDRYLDALVDSVRRLLELRSQHPAIEAPPAREAEKAALHGIPSQLTELIGRSEVCSELASRLRAGRLVSIVGPGGIGKTRCAEEVGGRMLIDFSDGVWFVDLAPVTEPAFVADALVSALNVPRSTSRSAIDAITAQLRGRRALLILDNCEHVIEEAARVVGTILHGCPLVAILTTSREPLGIFGEFVFRMPTLDVPPSDGRLTVEQALQFSSVQLFVARVSSSDPTYAFDGLDVSHIAEICRQLDGLPLALELAAARVRVLGIARLAESLNQRFRLLAGGDRTAPARQQTLRATVDWSYDFLNPAEKRLFRTLAVFIAGFTLDAAFAIANPDNYDIGVVGLLSSLIDKSLITVDSSAPKGLVRYRYLETIRAYAVEKQIAEQERNSSMRALLAWCVSFCKEAGTTWSLQSSDDWEASVIPEIDNVRAALAWALSEKQAVSLGQELTAEARRIWGRLLPSEGLRWLRICLGFVDEDTSAEISAALLLTQAQIDVALWKFDEALAAASDAERLYTGTNDMQGLLEARGFRGLALARLERGLEALPILNEVLESYLSLDNRQLAAHAVNDIAIAHLFSGDYAAANQRFREALEAFKAVGNERAAMTVSGNLAELQLRLGDANEAVALARDALSTGPRGREASTYLANLSAYLVQLDRWDEAREAARESLSKGGEDFAELDSGYALQHLAAVAALHPPAGEAGAQRAERELAARLLGFADSRLPQPRSARSFTETQEFDRVVAALAEALGSEESSRLQEEGRKLDLAMALALATAV